MTISRLRWTSASALAPGARVVPVLLVAGVPSVFTPAGIRPTTVAVTSGTLDPLFWPGTGTLTETLPGGTTLDPVEDLLDPMEQVEIYERISALKADALVQAITLSILDTGGRATALLSRRESLLSQQLASDLTASAVSVPLVNTANFPTGGIAAIGRETITYTGIGGGSLTGVTRGKYGSRARFHGAPVQHLPLVTAGGARHFQGRLATYWLCLLSADGTTISDPTLIFTGVIGPGVQLKGNLTRWSLPIDHVTAVMSRKAALPSLDLYGWAHYANDESHPLSVQDNGGTTGGDASLTDQNDAVNNLGWHESRRAFVTAADQRIKTVTTTSAAVAIGTDNRIRVEVYDNTNPHRTYVRFCWDDARWDNQRNDDFAYLASINPAPTDCFPLDGWVKIPTSLDFAKIPSTFAWSLTTSAGASGRASLALTADTKATKGLAAAIVERDATNSRVRVEASLPTRATMTAAEIVSATLCTERTVTQLGIIATGDNPAAALQAAAFALDAVTGQDLFGSAIDWTAVEAALLNAPSRLPQLREYRFGASDDTFLDVLADEARLHGLVIAVANGLVTLVPLATYADTEQTVDSITEADLLTEGGKEIPLEVIDNNEPLATSMQFMLPTADGKGRPVTVTDTTWEGEFGAGDTVKTRALLSLPRGTNLSGVQSALLDVAAQVLAVTAEPSRIVRIPASPRLMGTQPGQLLRFTHSRVPNWSGERGFTNAVCSVEEVRRVLFGGRLRATITLRLQAGTRTGYTPAALVSAGSLTVGSPVVTLDIGAGWGAAGFAPALDANGVATTDPAYGFDVGHKVRLSQYARAPIASEAFTIVSIDRVGHSVTLDANPSAAMVTAAGVSYGVVIRFAGYGTATATQQQRWAWLADPTTTLLGGTDSPRRWA